MKNQEITKIITTLIIAIILFVVSFMALQKAELFLKIKAYNDCANISRYEKTEAEGVKVWYPIPDVYKTCLKDKGY